MLMHLFVHGNSNYEYIGNDPCVGGDGTSRPGNIIVDDIRIYNSWVDPSTIYNDICSGIWLVCDFAYLELLCADSSVYATHAFV